MIKKIISIFYILCIAASAMQAQEKFKPEWNIGIGFGPTFSSVDFLPTTSGNSSVDTKTWQQFHGGIAIRYISEKRLGIIAELNYTQQGWEQKFSEESQHLNATYSRQLNYIEMPILTHIYFGNKVRFMFNLGPKLSYLFSDKEEMSEALSDLLSNGNLSSSAATYQYYRDLDKKFDYGIMAGTGIEFRTGIGNFALEGRYYFGLSDIFNNSKSDYFGRSANRVISAKLTYYVKLF